MTSREMYNEVLAQQQIAALLKTLMKINPESRPVEMEIAYAIEAIRPLAKLFAKDEEAYEKERSK